MTLWHDTKLLKGVLKYGVVYVYTRLISIMSKPILMVGVVVIDVVFVKKKLGQKKIWFKKIHVQINFRQNIFGSKRVRSKNVVVQKLMLSKKLRLKKCWVQKNVGSKKFWIQKFLSLEIWDLPLKSGQN